MHLNLALQNSTLYTILAVACSLHCEVLPVQKD